MVHSTIPLAETDYHYPHRHFPFGCGGDRELALQWIRMQLFRMFPMSDFMENTYYFILIVNVICSLVFVWSTLPISTYWTLVETLLLSLIIIQVNWFFLYETNDKEKPS